MEPSSTNIMANGHAFLSLPWAIATGSVDGSMRAYNPTTSIPSTSTITINYITMSFLTENIIRRVALAPRVIAIQTPRTFTTSFALQKTATETVKDAAKKVDRAVSDKIVDGIEVGG
ncbi:hypothetical protein NM208_g12318 [Fusarium decemcellulare]|uniref:Uncharacterized protein n=1 Tax=Fusarium decemcellulare TaxID=57161 RepID=A0ACC1RRR1_9HYPO|nr:hypothetical protein NM208_g12318 [Fusarium decemcellulare]